MASDSSSDVIGVVIMARHGDRRGYYQSPDTYTASDTTITPLGEVRFCVRVSVHFSDLTMLRASERNGSSVRCSGRYT